ncbi:MAG: YqiA/YcfP family alpha/beta fold hydrolase [Rhizobacter sp.]
MPALITHLLYLHGFRSSPQSKKAQQFGDWVRVHRPDLRWWCPQLPASPREALALLDEGTKDWPLAHTAVVGSSLGGFYATVLAERWARRGERASGGSVRVVLLNPAVHPARDLAAHIGETTPWHGGDRFFFRPEFVTELQEETPLDLTRPQRYFAIIAKGDEVLDWREMTARYAGCTVRLIEGGDHALSDFDDHLAAAIGFLGLEADPA